MEDLYIKALSTEISFSPEVSCLANEGKCDISGESYMDEAVDFYHKVTLWIVDYFNERNDNLQLNINLSYFNTSTSRAFIELFKRLNKNQIDHKKIDVKWYYPEGDDDMFMDIEDIKIESKVAIEIIES